MPPKKLGRAVLVALSILCIPYSVGAAEPALPKTTVAVVGSSLAAGWVTSYETRYDMQNGWAARLGRYLETQNTTLLNLSVPGDTVDKVLERFDKDVANSGADYVIIGLSLGNEGLVGGDVTAIMTHFSDGLQKIIARCRDRGMQPIVGSCYMSDDYEASHYQITQQMNARLQTWDVPVINFLGALEDGHGHFPSGFTYDTSHPENRGHEDLYTAIVPTLLDAVAAGKPVPERNTPSTGTKLPQPLHYVPDTPVHAFALSFSFRTDDSSVLSTLIDRAHRRQIEIRDGRLVYQANGARILESKNRIDDEQWHMVTLSHRHMAATTSIYLDGALVGRTPETLEVLQIALGGADNDDATWGEILIHRAALTDTECQHLATGRMLTGSLDVYASLSQDDSPINQAQSLAILTSDAPQTQDLARQYTAADLARKNEPVFPEKQPITVATEILKTYVGTYEIAPGDNMIVSMEGETLLLTDRGNASALLAEASDRFFIKYPLMDIGVEFQHDDGGQVSGLKFSVGEHVIPTKKVE